MLILVRRQPGAGFSAYLPLLVVLLFLLVLAVFLAQLVLKPFVFGLSACTIKIGAEQTTDPAYTQLAERDH